MADPQTYYLNRGESLPERYGEDRLVILPRDPHNIFAYWEISPQTREALARRASEEGCPEFALCLRVYKYGWGEGEDAEGFFDLEVSGDINNWYIAVPHADRCYRVELGWKAPGRSFQSLLRSNLIRTPRDSLSDLIDEQWQLPDWKAQKLFRRISLYHLSSAEFFRRRPEAKRK
ncbi:MAG: DUF4912 domain-containing protein [Firmicutes bacterium]|nr:DUF4912 domain-containing protein [Bacillota bacterium]